MQDDLNAQFLHARFQGGKRNLTVALHGVAVARVDECTGLPYRNVERRTLGQFAKIKIARVWARRHRGRNAGTQWREIAIRRRKAQGALERFQWNGDIGHELALHSAQIEIDVFDLPLRIVLWQEAGAERTW